MSKIAILLILILAALLRFLTLPKLLTFTADEAYLSYIAQTIIKDFHIIWIGWSALGFDVYLGPFWIYIFSPFLMLSRGDPIVLGYLNSSLGVASVFLLYWIGKKIFSEKIGLVASLLYAVLPLVVYYDQKPYPPGVPLLALVMTASLYMARYSGKWWLLFSVAYGMVFHTHLSLLLIILVAFYWAWLHRKLLDKKIVFTSILIFIMIVSPLIAFDYFHKGSNITAPLRALEAFRSDRGNSQIINHASTLYQSLGRIFYLKPFSQAGDEISPACTTSSSSTFTISPAWVSTLASLLLFYFMLSKNTWKDKNRRLLALLSLSFLVPFILLTIINPVEYYLLGFFPLFFLIIAIVIQKLKTPFNYLAHLLIFIAVLLGILTIVTAKGDFGLAAKQRLISRVMYAIDGDSFYLTTVGDCQDTGGWRYLFSVYGRRPLQSSEDITFGWLYPDELSKEKYKYSVIIKESRAPATVRTGYKFAIEEGGFTAYIFESH